MLAFPLFVLLSLALCAAVFSAEFNETSSAFSKSQAATSLWLSAAAYCGKSAYQTHTFKGPTAGFVVTYVIYDASTDTEGYIGYLPSDNSIYVTFRGSSSILNWISDLDALKTSYTSFPDCNCQVHKGFYTAEQKVIGGVISEVKRLRGKYPSSALKVTGHSLGAALAQLTSMDLVKAGLPCSVYNFGQPRVGDANYAKFSTNKVDTWRVTHNRDIVPHVPVTTGMEFVHMCREEFEDVNHSLKSCDTSCEDKTCADQYSLAQTNTDDHLVYLGMSVSCSAVSNY
jgi:hypothetical protein